MQLWWPIILIVCSNILYQLCAKLAPAKIHPMAGLTVTYAVSFLVSALAFFLLAPKSSLLAQYRHLNASYVLFGLALVGLEAGCIYMYKAGWPISVGQLVHSAILAVCLVLIGACFFHEELSASRLLGIVLIFCGIFLVNR
ncbi:MAG: hypothetical protein K6G15_01315 [Desulfovibrio sp.]|nr:hypothetical protein [Desulfovibrio sp.]